MRISDWSSDVCSSDLLDRGVQANIVDKSGAWFSYEGQRIGQGRENAKSFLKENTEMAAQIEAKIRANAGLVSAAMLEGGADDRSEEGRGGKECFSTFRSRWSRYS